MDVGTPFGQGTSVVDDGSSAEAIELSGYSIVEAVSLAEARKLAESHPFLSEGQGNYAFRGLRDAPRSIPAVSRSDGRVGDVEALRIRIGA